MTKSELHTFTSFLPAKEFCWVTATSSQIRNCWGHFRLLCLLQIVISLFKIRNQETSGKDSARMRTWADRDSLFSKDLFGRGKRIKTCLIFQHGGREQRDEKHPNTKCLYTLSWSHPSNRWLKNHLKNKTRGWRDGSVAKSTGCSNRGPGFGSPHTIVYKNP